MNPKVSGSALYRTDPPTPTVDPLKLFAEYFRTTYGIQVPGFIVLQLPPPPTLKVFNLAMIHSHDIVRRQLPTEELVRLMQRGNISSAIQGSTSVQLENLFYLDDRERKVILIEGAPGADKVPLPGTSARNGKHESCFKSSRL